MKKATINLYTKVECERLLDDPDFWNVDNLPVSRQRLLSQVNNPRARDDDVLLVTATEDSMLTAYMGMIPDIAYPREGTPYRFGWTTAWWQNPAAEDQTAAIRVLFKATESYGGQVGVSGCSEQANSVLTASRRFVSMGDFTMCYYLAELPASFKGRKLPNKLVNPLIRLKNRVLFALRGGSGLRIDYIKEFDAELDEFIAAQSRTAMFRPDKAFFDWIYKYSWGRSDEGRSDEAHSDSADKADPALQFEFNMDNAVIQQTRVCLRDGDAIAAFLWLTRRDDCLILKYAYFDDKYIDQVVRCLQEITHRDRAPFLVIIDQPLNAAFQRSSGYYLSKKCVPLHFLIGRHVEFDPNEPWQYGIGDRVFS